MLPELGQSWAVDVLGTADCRELRTRVEDAQDGLGVVVRPPATPIVRTPITPLASDKAPAPSASSTPGPAPSEPAHLLGEVATGEPAHPAEVVAVPRGLRVVDLRVPELFVDLRPVGWVAEAAVPSSARS